MKQVTCVWWETSRIGPHSEAGVSLHLDGHRAESFFRQYWDSMPARNDGSPYDFPTDRCEVVDVSEALFGEVQYGTELDAYGRNSPPSDYRKPSWYPLTDCYGDMNYCTGIRVYFALELRPTWTDGDTGRRDRVTICRRSELENAGGDLLPELFVIRRHLERRLTECQGSDFEHAKAAVWAWKDALKFVDQVKDEMGFAGSEGASMIAAERARHALEGWTTAHDAEYVAGELAQIAAAYALGPSACAFITEEGYFKEGDAEHWFDQHDLWPDTWDKAWDKRAQHDRLRCLEIAGALLAAEIDRVRAAESAESAAEEGAEQ